MINNVVSACVKQHYHGDHNDGDDSCDANVREGDDAC